MKDVNNVLSTRSLLFLPIKWVCDTNTCGCLHFSSLFKPICSFECINDNSDNLNTSVQMKFNVWASWLFFVQVLHDKIRQTQSDTKSFIIMPLCDIQLMKKKLKYLFISSVKSMFTITITCEKLEPSYTLLFNDVRLLSFLFLYFPTCENRYF